MADLFDITSATNQIHLDRERQGAATFTVTNTTDQLVRGRAQLVTEPPETAGWLSFEGETEREFPASSGTQQYTVNVTVPQDAQTGMHTVRLDMVGVENPDEDYSEGPALAFEVPEQDAAPTGFPWWIAALGVGIVAVAALSFVLWQRSQQAARDAEATRIAQANASAAATATAQAGAQAAATATEQAQQFANATATAQAVATAEAAATSTAQAATATSVAATQAAATTTAQARGTATAVAAATATSQAVASATARARQYRTLSVSGEVDVEGQQETTVTIDLPIEPELPRGNGRNTTVSPIDRTFTVNRRVSLDPSSTSQDLNASWCVGDQFPSTPTPIPGVVEDISTITIFDPTALSVHLDVSLDTADGDIVVTGNARLHTGNACSVDRVSAQVDFDRTVIPMDRATQLNTTFDTGPGGSAEAALRLTLNNRPSP